MREGEKKRKRKKESRRKRERESPRNERVECKNYETRERIVVRGPLTYKILLLINICY